MSHLDLNPPYTTEQLRRLHDQARADALQLRREAIEDFWRGANDMLGHAALSAQRSAVRLSHRLRRRAALWADIG